MNDTFDRLTPGTLCELLCEDLGDQFGGVLRGSFDDLDIPGESDWIWDPRKQHLVGEIRDMEQMVVIRDVREFDVPYGGVLFLTAIGPIWVKWWFMVHIHKVLMP